MTDWNALRAHFPVLEGRSYLNTAGGGPMCRQAAQAAGSYYKESCLEGDTRWSDWLARVETTRAQLARMVNASSREIAFLGNASQGLNLVADMLQGDGEVVALRSELNRSRSVTGGGTRYSR